MLRSALSSTRSPLRLLPPSSLVTRSFAAAPVKKKDAKGAKGTKAGAKKAKPAWGAIKDSKASAPPSSESTEWFVKVMANAAARATAKDKIPRRTVPLEERAIARRFQVETSKLQNREDWAREAAFRVKERAIKALPEALRKDALLTEERRLAAAMAVPANLPKPGWLAMPKPS